jgi:hypothetical protein
VLKPSDKPQRGVALKKAMDLDQALKKAIDKLRRDFTTLFQRYNSLVTELTEFHATEGSRQSPHAERRRRRALRLKDRTPYSYCTGAISHEVRAARRNHRGRTVKSAAVARVLRAKSAANISPFSYPWLQNIVSAARDADGSAKSSVISKFSRKLRLSKLACRRRRSRPRRIAFSCRNRKRAALCAHGASRLRRWPHDQRRHAAAVRRREQSRPHATLQSLADDAEFQQQRRKVKLANKRRLATLIGERTGVSVAPEWNVEIRG